MAVIAFWTRATTLAEAGVFNMNETMSGVVDNEDVVNVRAPTAVIVLDV